ncbi:MAG: LTA synthase family protein [Bacteroidales bacterium]
MKNTAKSIYNNSVYSLLIWRIFLVMISYSIARIFFIIFNSSHFENANFTEYLLLLIKGLRFDFSAILFLNLPFIVWALLPFPFRGNKFWNIISNILFYPINIIGIGSNFGDIVYYRFILKRTTADVFHFVHQEGQGFLPLIPQFIKDFWFYFLLWIIVSIVFVYLVQRFKLRKDQKLGSIPLFIFKHLIGILITVAIAVIGMRGGLQLKPISNISAGQMTKPTNTPILLNTPFSILKTLDQKGIDVPDYYSLSECYNTFNPILQFPTDITKAKKPNIVVIIMESFSAEHMAYFNQNIPGYKGFTPFLDSLASQSVAIKGWANGKRSIEGIPAVTAGIPSWMPIDYPSSPYSNNKINSLASLLDQENYRTAFFHGGNNGTMSFDAFTNLAGYQNYYGRNEYNNDKDFDGVWGIFDHAFFQYFGRKLGEFKQPFMGTIFSLSSHHPYTIPKEFKGKFRSGKLPIQKSIMYADYSLKLFFDSIKDKDWYKNTLFVITADHTSEAALPFYKTNVGQYSVPIIFFHPQGKLNISTDITAQQIDIMPSILNYVNYDKPFFAFGRSLFDSTATHYAMNYLSGNWQMIQKEFSLEFNGKETEALFNFQNDSTLDHNIKIQFPERVRNMEKLTKVLIQEFNTSMVENKLTVNQNTLDQK